MTEQASNEVRPEGSIGPVILTRLMTMVENAKRSMEGCNLTTEGVATFAKSADLAEVGTLLRDLKDVHEALESLKSHVGKVYDYYRTVTVPGRMDDEGVETVKISGVGRLGLTSDLNVSCPDKTEAFKWLEEIGSGDLIQDTVNAASLKAMLKRRLQSGEDIPDTIYVIKPFTRASITKS